MSRQRRNFSAKFKSDLVIELLKGEKDLNTLATENNIQPNLLRNWKKEFLNNASVVFDDKREENLKDKLAQERREKAEYEKEIIQLRLNDTNGIENFVKNFAKAYDSWDTSKEAIEARTTEISKYITKELQDLNADTIRTDIPTSATVTNVLVWNVEQSGTDDFTVAYEVDQQVKEGEQTQAVT